MKFLTALVATFALSVAQPAMAQVYTQQEINYLQAMEQQNYVEMTSHLIQKTLPYAHMVCDLHREGYSYSEAIRYSSELEYNALRTLNLTDAQMYYAADVFGTSFYYASEVLCPRVR